MADENNSINRVFANWIAWKVALPLLLILSIYALIRFILEIPDPFGKAFAHGDLLIFSALVLLEAATEGEYVVDENTKKMVVRIIAKIFAILLIVVFVATKSDVLNKENQLFSQFTTDGHLLLAKKMVAYSCLNCTVALVSVIGSVLMFWFNVHSQQQQEYARLGQR